MNTRERIKLAAKKQREYTENAAKCTKAKKDIKTAFILACVLFVGAILLSTYTFFFDILPKDGSKSLNFGLIQLAIGIVLEIIAIAAVYRKDKRLIYIAAAPLIYVAIYALFGNTELRASIHNWCGIPVDSRLNVRILLIAFCVLSIAVFAKMHIAINDYCSLSQCEGFPHFVLRCNKLEDYMPDEYTLPEDRIDTPDTLTSDDFEKYQEIENNTTTSYTPGVMDTIGPIDLDDE